MNVTAHGRSLLQLTRMGVVNAYLVREQDGFTLVDTGMSGSAKGILAAAPEAEVSIGARDARLLRKDRSMDPGEPPAKLRGSFPGIETTPARELSPGDRVGSLEVVAAPGHTPGHIAFLDTRDRTLIAGDAFQTLGGVAVSGVVRPLFPLPALATWHLPTALESAQALRGLEPSRLATGHGRVLDAPTSAMDAAIASAAKKAR